MYICLKSFSISLSAKLRLLSMAYKTLYNLASAYLFLKPHLRHSSNGVWSVFAFYKLFFLR